MSSSQVFAGGFGASRQRKDWFTDHDGALATTLMDQADDKRVVWDLTDYLASSETVSSAAYVDSGAVTSSKSVSSPQVIFTVTGYGSTKVTATLSTGRQVTQVWRTYPPSGNQVKDYGG